MEVENMINQSTILSANFINTQRKKGGRYAKYTEI